MLARSRPCPVSKIFFSYPFLASFSRPELKEEKKQRKSEHRILLLGCGEAGKSTFIKQMRIIHSEGFSDAERREFQNNISVNIVSAIQTLIFNSELAYEDEDVAEAEAAGADLDQALIEAVKRVNGLSARAMPSQVLPLAEDISLVWKQPEVRSFLVVKLKGITFLIFSNIVMSENSRN